MIIRDYNFDTTQVTAMTIDIFNGDKLWIAFAKNSDGECIVQKVSANDLTQVDFEIALPVDAVVEMLWFDSDTFYILVDDATALFYKTDPQQPTVPEPVATNITVTTFETPISIKDDGTYTYILYPGSSNPAKIMKYNGTTYVEQIILTAVNNVIGMTVSGTDLWVVTNTSPSNLVRVYQLSGGIYTYTKTPLFQNQYYRFGMIQE